MWSSKILCRIHKNLIVYHWMTCDLNKIAISRIMLYSTVERKEIKLVKSKEN